MTNAIALKPAPDSNHGRLVLMLDSEREITGSEEGRALNVEGFIGQALDHLKAGNYEGFLTCADLAGEFAKQARDELYSRRQRIEQADRAARLAEFGCQPIGNVRPIDSNTMYAAVQRINENTAAAAIKWAAEPLRSGRWVVRPEGQLGTCGWVNGIGWEAQFVNASSAAEALRKAGR